MIFTGRTCLQDFRDMVGDSYKYHRGYRVVHVLSMGLALCGIVYWAIRGTGHWALYGSLVPAYVIYHAWWWVRQSRWITRTFRELEHLLKENTVTFSGDGIVLATEDEHAFRSWAEMAVIVVSPRGLLFVLRPHQPWFWMPQRVFSAASQREAILAEAVSGKVRVVKIR